MNNVVVSFLKENGIKYYLHKHEKEVSFPCFHCLTEVKICLIRTFWSCQNCGNKGTLVHLIDFLRTNSSVLPKLKEVELYQRENELNEIKVLLEQIGDNRVISELKREILALLKQEA